MKFLPSLIAVLVFALAIMAGQAVVAHGEQTAETAVAVAPLLSEIPADLSGKRITMVAVTYPPGSSFQPHRHPGSVLVYVASGEIRSQLDTDADPITYKTGDVWYESPDARHVYSENPSDKVPAKIIAILIGDDGADLVLPDSR
ncbi:MAG: cupin domain-containing protein [Gammaproteobacteria bacterium]